MQMAVQLSEGPSSQLRMRVGLSSWRAAGLAAYKLASTTQRGTRFDASSELRCAATSTQHHHNRLNPASSNMAEQAITQGAIKYVHLNYRDPGNSYTQQEHLRAQRLLR